MSVGVILMTALVPTNGHKFLIEFGSAFVDELYVIVSSRSHEPVSGWARLNTLGKSNSNINISWCSHKDDDAPQNPTKFNDTEFWDYWKNTVLSFTKKPVDFVFASEKYGQDVADSLEATFIPVDIARETIPISGTKVRNDLFNSTDFILPEFIPYLKSTVTIFGQESTGKSTLGRALAKKFNGIYLPEWARPYLELVGSEPTEERMLNIVQGQYAFMEAAKTGNKLITFQDTDLLSTLGFYRSWNMIPPDSLVDLVHITVPDLYIMTNDSIPFEADILRYGGTERETTMEFWIDLLDEFRMPYHVLKSVTLEDRIAECEEIIMSSLPARNGIIYKNIKEFERE